MSRENVELVKRIFDGWSHGDFSVGLDLVTADFEWQQHAEAVEPGLRRGTGIAKALRNIFEVYEGFRVVPERYIGAGDKVVVIARIRGTARSSGIELNQGFAFVWTVQASKLVRVEVYEDERAALNAADLPQ